MPRGPRETSRKETGREERVPLGVRRAKLEAPQRRGYVRRWVNDWPGRIEAAQRAGYEFVHLEAGIDEEERERRFETVGTNEDGTPLRSYLMEIKERFYQEDQTAKEEEIAALEASMHRGATQGPVNANDRDQFYVAPEHRGIRKAGHI